MKNLSIHLKIVITWASLYLKVFLFRQIWVCHFFLKKKKNVILGSPWQGLDITSLHFVSW